MAPKRKHDEGGDAAAPSAAVVSKSPAEFFANNKTIAGFDNPGKSLYTTMREFVENALDAAESIGALPDIFVTIEEISQQRFNTLFGVESVERKNASLYRDSDVPKDKKAKKAADIQDAPPPTDADDAKKKAASARGSGALYYRVTVRDNGSGMAHRDIPELMGRVLTGTKYSVKQQRGRFGLGAKMALIWSQMSTGCPITIRSSVTPEGPASFCKLHIDVSSNTPAVIEHKQVPLGELGRGTEVTVVIEGNFATYRAKILNYMRQLAVITPYGLFEMRFVAETESRSFAIRYARRSEEIPAAPREVAHHPSSVSLMLMKRLLDESAAANQSFGNHLVTKYSSIDRTKAAQIIEELGDSYSFDMPAAAVRDEQMLRLLQLFKEIKFQAPDGSCLSPIGEYNLRLGIMKEMRADMIATYEEKTHVYEGHPFIVEAAVSLGGKSVGVGLNIYRFANRIPLLFEAGADVVTRQASKKINWPLYRIKPTTDRIGVFVSIVSTKIPFKGTGKEYVGDDIEEIASAVKHAIQQCCVQLKARLSRISNLKQQRERKQQLLKHIPSISRSLFTVASAVAKQPGALGGAHASLLRRISANEVVEHTLAQHLTQFVEKHADMEELQEEEEGQRIPTSAEAGGDAHALRLVPWRPAQQVLTASIGGINMAFLPSILTQ